MVVHQRLSPGKKFEEQKVENEYQQFVLTYCELLMDQLVYQHSLHELEENNKYSKVEDLLLSLSGLSVPVATRKA